jgi:ABC-type branched-subunit amino acid transport system ATPase component/ABC-type branched-subunit amino acid transport system permease subunit
VVLATWFTPQLFLNGVVSGLVYGLLAMGIVLVYRSTRVINLAVANLGMVGAGLFVLLAVQYRFPYWLAAIIGLLVGTLYGAIIELVVIRRLFTAPRVIVLVATIGVAQLSLAILTAYPSIDVRGARFPQAIGGDLRIAGVRITGAQLLILIVVPLVAAALGWFLTRTTLGRTVKASASNPDLARLLGISPKLVSAFSWAAAGLLATLSLALIAGQAGTVQGLDALGPSTLVRALAAAVLAGMASFPRALVAGVAIGVAQSLVQFNWLDQPGLVDMVLFLGVLVAVYLQTRSGPGETSTFAFTSKARPVPERLRQRWWVRQFDRVGLMVILGVAIVLPLVVTQPSRHLLYTTIVGFALCALSVTVLTGWAGQLSLGQMAFAGLGALLAAGFSRGMTMDVGWGEVRVVDAGLEPLTFASSAALAVAITSGLAALIGAGALRVRGLLLAVSTFAFAVAATQFLFRQPMLTGGRSGPVSFRRSEIVGIDLTSQRSFYYFGLACLVVAAAMVGRLRRTGIGRATIAVRDNPDTAAAYTVPPTRTKLRVFALAGGIAALGGIVLAGSIGSIPNDRFFTVNDSLLLVAIAVIGGLGSVAGAVIGALWVVGLPALFPANELVPLLTSSLGLLVLLLYFPGGLVRIAHTARDALLGRVYGQLGPAPLDAHRSTPVIDRRAIAPIDPDVPALAVRHVTVHFGGVAAVHEVSLTLAAEEVVGLIGTNGAGKTTLMNAICGFVSSSGTVELLGEDVTRRPPAARASAGLGRTFQAATLFPELTVRETVAVALEARTRSGLLSAALSLPRSVRNERAKRAEAGELIDFLGLGRFADVYVAELSTGTRRIVELAGLLAVGARVLCLDEPTAGVAQREAEAFGPLILEIRRHLGASMLVIEHDMPLVMGISDRVCCLEAGRVIAEGDPATVRHDPLVVASYLGTDERAIARSGGAAVMAVTT